MQEYKLNSMLLNSIKFKLTGKSGEENRTEKKREKIHGI